MILTNYFQARLVPGLMFLCSMRYSILLLFFLSLSAQAQKKINKIPVNELELNTHLSVYESDLFLITGEEEIYATNPNLKKNVLRNISWGIREGLYGGYTLNVVDGLRASRTTLFFYKEELYKVRWSFLSQDHPDLKMKASQLGTYLEKRYGSSEEQIPGVLQVWESKKKYLQSFSEYTEFQIEYRDEKIHRLVEQLK